MGLRSGPPTPVPSASPFHGGVCVESYQLVPLLKALRMPRVSLLIADDVGLGKTVEAGLILTELLLRHRIRRVLVLTPASLRRQWQEELRRRRDHYEEIRGQLQRERTRVVEHLLPARFALAGSAQAFPVAVEIRLPERRA